MCVSTCLWARISVCISCWCVRVWCCMSECSRSVCALCRHVHANTSAALPLASPRGASFHPDVFSSRLHRVDALYLSSQGWPHPSPTNLTVLFLVPRRAWWRMNYCCMYMCVSVCQQLRRMWSLMCTLHKFDFSIYAITSVSYKCPRNDYRWDSKFGWKQSVEFLFSYNTGQTELTSWWS